MGRKEGLWEAMDIRVGYVGGQACLRAANKREVETATPTPRWDVII